MDSSNGNIERVINKIDNYFNKDTEETELQESSSKRLRCNLSSSGDTPSPKKTAIGDDPTLLLPEEAPHWVPTLFKSIDQINQSVEQMSIKLDTFKVEIDIKIEGVMKQTDIKLKELESSFTERLSQQDKIISELSEGVKFVSEGYEEQKKLNEELSKKLKEAESHNEIIKSKCRSYEETLDFLIDENDNLEQYGRRNCLLLHGVPEDKGEKTDDVVISTINNNLKVGITLDDLDRSHRIGKPRGKAVGGKAKPPRAIIIKFARYYQRRRVFTNKKLFKGSMFAITESLTKKRMKVLTATKLRYGNNNVWTSDGEILVKQGETIVNAKSL